MENIYSPLKGEEGKVASVIVAVRDVTDIAQAQSELRASEERMQVVIESSPIGIRINRQDGKLAYVNPALIKMFGYESADEMLGLSVEALFKPEDRALLKQRQRDIFSGKQDPPIFEWVGMKKNGDQFDVKNFFTIIEHEGKPAIVGFVIDVSLEKKLESQLRQVQKMEAIGTLAGGIAHDFNNILYSIIGFAEMGEDKSDENSKVFRYFREILRAGNRGSGLTKNILAFCRQEEPEKKPSLIQPVIKESLEMLSAVIPSTIKIDRRIDRQCGPVLCDPAQIQQVIVNLCTNAYQVMPDTGGNLEVTLSEVDIGPGYHISLKPGTYLQLTVGDDGHGISAEDMKRIFDPYFTTKEKGKGTGLGLSVVHGIVKNHGGEITVSSEPGKGSTFNVYLPRIIDDSGEEEGVRTIPESIPGGKENILLVDDEPTIVDMLTEFLEGIGYHVTAHTGSVKALEAFRLQPEKFDVVITDMTMPEMPGDRLSQKLLEIRPDIPIIICTGFSERVNEEQAKAMGIREFIMKPAQRGKLARLIRKVMED